MKKKHLSVSSIEKLHFHINAIKLQFDKETTIEIPCLEQEVFDELVFRQGKKDYFNMLNAISASDIRRAKIHCQRLDEKIKYCANDFPAKVGDNVAVIRYEHGWPDGRWLGFVKQAWQNGKKWSYVVTINYCDGKNCEPYDICVNHTRDLMH